MKKNILLFLVFILTGCKVQDLSGRFYQFANTEKEVSLDFLTDSTCIIKQNYKCPNLPEIYKNIEIECFIN